MKDNPKQPQCKSLFHLGSRVTVKVDPNANSKLAKRLAIEFGNRSSGGVVPNRR